MRGNLEGCKRVEDGFSWRNDHSGLKNTDLNRIFYKYAYTDKNANKTVYESVKKIKKLNVWIPNSTDFICIVHYCGA